MCGIFGLLQSGNISVTEVAQMGRALKHRGPDDDGLVLFGPGGPAIVSATGCCPDGFQGGIALGHRRLSIIDLSSLGHQPMCYRGRFWITYNGEVYNYMELREELRSLGHEFAGQSDTEVILAAYCEWGPSCLARFIGMWSFAILDLERGTLFLARDRFGIKPLYFWNHAGRLAFASEIKAFSVLEGWRPRPNLPRLLDFLVWNVSDHTDETCFEGVRQVAPGHHLLCDVGGILRAGEPAPRVVEQRAWYHLTATEGLEGPDYSVALRVALEDSVRLHLRSDVPVGSCLSGGLDSSAIVCLMSTQLRAEGSSNAVEAFSAVSEYAAFDEREFAKAVLKASGANGHFVEPLAVDFLRELPILAWHQDEPFLSTSIFAQWRVFGAARDQGIKVMLDGQGADESLCGYRGFFGAYMAELLKAEGIGSWMREASSIRKAIGFSLARSAAYTIAYQWPGTVGALGRLEGRAYSERSWIDAAYRKSFLVDPVRRAGGRTGSVQAMSKAQITTTNLPMLLRWEDRNSMAFSIEARVPYLDHRLVELCLGIPNEAKLGGGIAKRVLRDAMRGTVPDVVLDRRDKMGFMTAEPIWMRGEAAREYRAEIKRSAEALSGIISPRVVDQFDEFLAGRRRFDQRFLRVISAGSWWARFGLRSP